MVIFAVKITLYLIVMKPFLVICMCFFSFISQGYSQSSEEKQRQEYLEEAEERKNQYIKDFVATLNVDEFQQQIIKQTLDSYFNEWTKIAQYDIPSYEKKTLAEELDAKHFNDLKLIVTDDILQKVKDAVKMENYKEIQKKIKKRKKKQKNKN